MSATFFPSSTSYYCLDLRTKLFSQTYGKGSPYPLLFTPKYIRPGFPQANSEWVGEEMEIEV